MAFLMYASMEDVVLGKTYMMSNSFMSLQYKGPRFCLDDVRRVSRNYLRTRDEQYGTIVRLLTLYE